MATRGRVAFAVALVLPMVLALLWWRDEPVPLPQSTAALGAVESTSERGETERAETPRDDAPAVASAQPPPRAKPRPSAAPRMTDGLRERRQRVLDALGTTASGRKSAVGYAPTNAPPSAADDTAPIKDKTGMMGAEVAALNEQFLPLVGDCIDQAKERGVRGRGMLALSVTLAGAEGIGRIIESVEPTDGNAIDDAELIECVRQSAFTVDLPERSTTSLDEGELTIPFDDGPDAGAAERR